MKTLIFLGLFGLLQAQVVPPTVTQDNVTTLIVSTVTVLTEIQMVFSSDGHPYVQGFFEVRSVAQDGTVLGMIKTVRVSIALADISGKSASDVQAAINTFNTLLTTGLNNQS